MPKGRLSSLGIFSLLLILNDHGEEHVTVLQIEAFPFVDLDSLDFLIKPESDIPHPDDSVFIKPLVFNKKHSLSIIEFSVFCDHHSQLVSGDFKVSFMDNFTLSQLFKIVIVC